MNKTFHLFIIGTVFGVLGLASPSFGTLSGVNVSSFSSQLAQGGGLNRQAFNTVNESGLTGNQHDTTATDMWLSTGDGTAGGGCDPFVTINGCAGIGGQIAQITYNLSGGSVVQVGTMYVWNYNEFFGSSFVNRGVDTLQVSTSPDGTTFTPIIDPLNSSTTWVFAEAPGTTGYTPQVFSFSSPVSAAFIRFDILTNYGDAHDFVGLSEVGFDAPTPEPGTGLLMLSAIGLLIGARARFRR